MTKTERMVAFLATARCMYERMKAHKRLYKAFKAVGVILIALCFLSPYTLAVSRYAGEKAVAAYQARMEKANEEERARLAAEKYPYFEQLEREAKMCAQMLEGVKLYGYDEASKKTLIQCVINRVNNPGYPNDIESVLAEKGQFEFYTSAAPVTESNYWLCYDYLDKSYRSERLACSYDLVFLELGKDKVVLRNTFAKEYRTETWWYGK